MIRAADLTKRFGQTVAVDRVSFAVEKGEIVGFLGPNGAGKTTTIRMLTCYHPATSGSASIAGHDVLTDPVRARRALGYLPENVPLYPDMRVEEYLAYRAALKGVPRRARRTAVGSAMERCGVVDVRRKLVGHVSRGYRQRVGLADALVARPPILILDEPTSGLDPNQRRRMKALIRELSAEHTILFSSHILAEVSEVSSRILIIGNGRLLADGTLESLLASVPGRALTLTALAPEPQLRALVDAVHPLGAAVQVDAGADGWTTLRVDLAAGSDPRAAIGERLCTAGVPVRALEVDAPTLERVFAQLTEGGMAPPP